MKIVQFSIHCDVRGMFANFVRPAKNLVVILKWPLLKHVLKTVLSARVQGVVRCGWQPSIPEGSSG